ncbi:PREDICTED: uncharacterized protein LOC101310911 [Fragaria vesca subsp. vesca]|uniref:uncharacterized protein LOC101310911 n=1 Tax=Fragaria vesca subsp. vesca TaxID=101020 RepID=UPI0002C30F7D|nr:PREDICTED: uncharacterized protein LOC101310911 [Fragaria vesca subsp. vesca]
MGDSSSASYIHMVHHLIEECIIFNMTREECMEALSKHAKIKPIITSTVWKELEKENKEFFEAYTNSREAARESKTERKQRIQKMLSGHLSKTDTDESSCTTTESDD